MGGERRLERATGSRRSRWCPAPLSAACHDDVVQHCSDIQPGQGRVHECLRAIPNALSPACKAAETSAEAQEAEDIRLKPQLLEACQVIEKVALKRSSKSTKYEIEGSYDDLV